MKSQLINRALQLCIGMSLMAGLAITVPASAQTESNPVVIQLPNGQVTLDTFNAQFDVAVRMLAARQEINFASQPADKVEALRKQYLNQRASELAMLQEADRLKVAVDDKQIDAAVAEFHHQAGESKSMEEVLKQTGLKDEAQLRDYLSEQGRIRLVTEVLLKKIVIPPGDVLTMHHDIAEQMQTPEVICMRQIAVADEQTATDLKNKLKGGADFTTVAKEHSTDKKTAEKGGDMGCFEKERAVAQSDFENAAFTAITDEVTGPVKSEFGYHLVLVYERRAPHTPTINEVYDELEDELRHEKLPDMLAKIREDSKIVIYPERMGGQGANVK